MLKKRKLKKLKKKSRNKLSLNLKRKTLVAEERRLMRKDMLKKKKIL